MNFGDFLKGLVIDTWYKVFVYIGVITLIISFFVNVKGITNSELQMLSIGFLLIGIGEWNNWKIAIQTQPGGYWKIPVRVPNLLGILFDILGIILFLVGLGHFIWSFFS
jgi:hypothetical protein